MTLEKENSRPTKRQDDDDEDDFDEFDEKLQENQYLTFGIQNEVYGINILSVVEIIRLISITTIPESFDFIKGIINLRGKIIPVMDVRIRFNLDEKEYDDRTCIIVTNINGYEMGMIVDMVLEVLEIPEEQVEPMPSVGSSGQQRFIRGIGKMEDGVKILLDLNRLLFDEELGKIKEIIK